jgi:hypothetical protein
MVTDEEVTDVTTARFLRSFVAESRTFIARVLTPATSN